MALRPDEFYDHAVAVADSERRLPLARMTGWEISPFEPDGLRVAPLRPPVLPEPARHGEDPSDCNACRDRDDGIWFNDQWRLVRIPGVGVPLVLMLYPRDHYDMADLPDELAAELGLLSTRIVRHVQALPHISRAHVYRIGDGGAHLHVWFFARPEGQAQGTVTTAHQQNHGFRWRLPQLNLSRHTRGAGCTPRVVDHHSGSAAVAARSAPVAGRLATVTDQGAAQNPLVTRLPDVHPA